VAYTFKTLKTRNRSDDGDDGRLGCTQRARWAAGIIGAAALLRRHATVMASAIRLPSSKPHSPPSRQEAYQRAGYKPGTTVGFEGFEGGERGARSQRYLR
jgi:hypothetical protein